MFLKCLLTSKMSEIETLWPPLHFSRTFNAFILINKKVLDILILTLKCFGSCGAIVNKTFVVCFGQCHLASVNRYHATWWTQTFVWSFAQPWENHNKNNRWSGMKLHSSAKRQWLWWKNMAWCCRHSQDKKKKNG